MTNIVNTPSQSAEDSSGGLLGFNKLALQKALQNLDCCLPAKITAYDRLTNRATVEPQYKVTSTGGDTLQMAQIESIPVLLIGGGDVFISFNLKEGDLGWIIANDQDISLFLQNYKASPGNTKRMHSFSDAVFIPDLMKDYYLASSDKASIQTKAGTTSITITDGSIDITVSDKFTVVSNVDLKGRPNIKIPQGSIARSGDNPFKLLSDVTLDESGQGIGTFKSVIAGEVSCSENTLNFIVSKVAGWNSVNNQSKGEPQGEKVGVNITDSEITFNAPKLTINTPITITGDVRVNGNITASVIIQGNTP